MFAGRYAQRRACAPAETVMQESNLSRRGCKRQRPLVEEALVDSARGVREHGTAHARQQHDGALTGSYVPTNNNVVDGVRLSARAALARAALEEMHLEEHVEDGGDGAGDARCVSSLRCKLPK